MLAKEATIDSFSPTLVARPKISSRNEKAAVGLFTCRSRESIPVIAATAAKTAR
jgi:hypothetical protein